MGRLMSFLRSTASRITGGMGKWVQKPASVIGAVGQVGWRALEWSYEAVSDVLDYTVDIIETAVDYTANAALHVGQDVYAGADAATKTTGKLAWNNPVSKVARNIGSFMIGDNRPAIVTDKDKQKAAEADKPLKQAKDMNPAELAKVKAEWIKKDPDHILEYAGAESSKEREAALGKMSPKAREWVSNLSPTDLWAVKNSAVQISAHLAGDKEIAGLTKIASYYGAANAIEAAPAAPKPETGVKTVTERRQEREATKKARREAANGTAVVAGAVPGQGSQPQMTAQQQIVNFFGPRVAREEEVSPYSSSFLPAYRPPVPMRRTMA